MNYDFMTDRFRLNTIFNEGKYNLENFAYGTANKGFKIFVEKFVQKFSRKIVINDQQSKKLIDYLLQFSPGLEKKLVNGLFPADWFCVVWVDINTCVIVVNGNPLLSSQDKYIINRVYKEDHYAIDVYIVGKYADRVNAIITDLVSISNKGLVIYNISSQNNGRMGDDDRESFQSIITDLNERSIDTLFYKDDIKEEIINHIDSFFKNKEIYERRNIAFKTGILLYGEPGTGKSSLANAIASKYGLNIVLVNIATFDKLDVQTLTSCFNADEKTYLCLLEDIDTLYNINREGEEVVDKDDKKVINKLLQFLDSNSSPNNVIFVATTNYVEKLDEALLREGRFGKKFYIGPITEVEAKKMIKSFDCTDEMMENIMSKIEDKNNINQSKLQGLILDEFKNKEKEEVK